MTTLRLNPTVTMPPPLVGRAELCAGADQRPGSCRSHRDHASTAIARAPIFSHAQLVTRTSTAFRTFTREILSA
jgi:hypothetical protein